MATNPLLWRNCQLILSLSFSLFLSPLSLLSLLSLYLSLSLSVSLSRPHAETVEHSVTCRTARIGEDELVNLGLLHSHIARLMVVAVDVWRGGGNSDNY